MSSRRSIQNVRVQWPGRSLAKRVSHSRRALLRPVVTARALGAGLLIAGIVGVMLPTGCRGPADVVTPPAGGARFVLPYDTFVLEVEPVLRRQGCGATGDCHGGGIRGTFVLSPAERPDPRQDFEQVRLQVDGYRPEQSPLLLKPLALDAGGTPHGAKAFATTSDPDYQALADWIARGVFE